MAHLTWKRHIKDTTQATSTPLGTNGIPACELYQCSTTSCAETGLTQQVSVVCWTTIVTQQTATGEKQQKAFHSRSANLYPHTGPITGCKKSLLSLTPWHWDNTGNCKRSPLNYSFTNYWFFTSGWVLQSRDKTESQVILAGLLTSFLCSGVRARLLSLALVTCEMGVTALFFIKTHTFFQWIYYIFTTFSDTGRMRDCRRTTNCKQSLPLHS